MTDAHTTWFQGISDDSDYFSQYENAIELLFNEINENKNIDSLILPTLFLLRHALELGMKYNIKYFSKYSEKNDFLKKLNNTHNLKELFDAFCVHIRASLENFGCSKKDELTKQIEEQIKKSEKIIFFLEGLDKKGTTFRYSEDIDGEKSLARSDNFNIIILND